MGFFGEARAAELSVEAQHLQAENERLRGLLAVAREALIMTLSPLHLHGERDTALEAERALRQSDPCEIATGAGE